MCKKIHIVTIHNSHHRYVVVYIYGKNHIFFVLTKKYDIIINKKKEEKMKKKDKMICKEFEELINNKTKKNYIEINKIKEWIQKGWTKCSPFLIIDLEKLNVII